MTDILLAISWWAIGVGCLVYCDNANMRALEREHPATKGKNRLTRRRLLAFVVAGVFGLVWIVAAALGLALELVARPQMKRFVDWWSRPI